MHLNDNNNIITINRCTVYFINFFVSFLIKIYKEWLSVKEEGIEQTMKTIFKENDEECLKVWKKKGYVYDFCFLFINI